MTTGSFSTDELAKWWGSDDLYRTTKHTVDLRAGGAYKSEGIGREGDPFHVTGTILEVDPPKRLVQTWQPSWATGAPTTVTWMLEPIATGTRLTVRHAGFTNPAACDDHAKGWERVLAWLGGYAGPVKPAQYFVSKLLPPGPTFMLDMTKDERDMMIAHSGYWRGLLAEGKAIAFGPVGGPTGGYGLGILKAADEAALKAMQAEDPAIKSQRGFTYDNAPLVTLVLEPGVSAETSYTARMWRWVPVVVSALAGCASPSDAQVLADLQARATSCGDIDDNCVARTDANAVAECMNKALELDKLASTAWSDYDTKGYVVTYHVFVDSGEVRAFYDQPDDSGGPNQVTELWSCPGPLSVSTNTVCGTMPVLTAPGCF